MFLIVGVACTLAVVGIYVLVVRLFRRSSQTGPS
jgi:hypothetical protein